MPIPNHTTAKPIPDPLFFMWCREAITTLREAGLTDLQIGGILAAIRSAACKEERQRLNTLMTNSPPSYIRGSVMAELLKTNP